MREIPLNGYIDEEVRWGDEITPEILHGLLYAPEASPDEDVHITLNSYGGNCNAAVRMHDDLQAYPGQVYITISGTAASAATVLAMGANRLEITSGSLFMIHDPSVVAMGNERDLMDAINLLKACKESIINIYQKRCRLSREEISDLMSATTWMDARQALDYGFVDSVATAQGCGVMNAVADRSAAEKLVNAWGERKMAKPKKDEPSDDLPENAEPEIETPVDEVLEEPAVESHETLSEPVVEAPESPDKPEEPAPEQIPDPIDNGAETAPETPQSGEATVSAQTLEKRLALLSIQI